MSSEIVKQTALQGSYRVFCYKFNKKSRFILHFSHIFSKNSRKTTAEYCKISYNRYRKVYYKLLITNLKSLYCNPGSHQVEYF